MLSLSPHPSPRPSAFMWRDHQAGLGIPEPRGLWAAPRERGQEVEAKLKGALRPSECQLSNFGRIWSHPR